MRVLTKLVLASAMGVGACGFPVPGDKYRVEDAAAMRALVDVYAGNDPECADAIQEVCGEQLKACLASEGCVEQSACRWGIAHPGAEERCITEVALDEEGNLAYNGLDDCVATRSVACHLGRDFGCAQDYLPPRPPAKTIVVAQTLLLFGQGVPASGVKVEMCSPFPTCADPIVTTKTDKSGYFEVELPIQQEPVSLAGWSGYRRLSGETIGSVRLQSNLPLWGNQHSVTNILTRSNVDDLIQLFGLPHEQAILVQVFDCQRVGAEGVVLEVEGIDYPMILYKDSHKLTDFGGEATSAEMEGAAVILNLEAERSYRISARRKSDDLFIGDAEVFIEPRQLAYLSLYPNYRTKP